MDCHEEEFNQIRMNRCADIHKRMMNDWTQNRRLRYLVRATEKLDGLVIDDLRKLYFAVGVTEYDAVEIPFHDMLVVFQMLEQSNVALQERQLSKKTDTEFTVRFQIKTSFPDEEVIRLLSAITIDLPFDGGKAISFLKVLGMEEPSDDEPFDEYPMNEN